jgi:outer membrane protein assembly factor BamB
VSICGFSSHRKALLLSQRFWTASVTPIVKSKFLFEVVAPLASLLIAVNAEANISQSWHQWRGPSANGVAPHADPPLEWSETKNVKWKINLPGFGSSTPIIWGNRIFISAAIAKSTPIGRGSPTDTYQFVLLCLDRQTGKTLWQKVARELTPHEGHHQDHGYASASPVTDGEHVLAYFGSRGLYCFDLEGNLKWAKDFGDMQTRNGFGEGTSPALHGNTVVVYWDHEGSDDFVLALDKRNGSELWRTPRNEGTGWSTSLIVEHAGEKQVVINATGKVRSYDFATGRPIWEIGGQAANTVPTPVTGDGIVYVTSGHRGSALQAIKLGATGDLTGTAALLWSHGKNTPYVPSPLLVDGLLYFISSNQPLLSCFDAKTGRPHFEAERLAGLFGVYASPVSAKDRVYVLGREGVCLVVKKGPKMEVLATNKLDDKTDASIALVGNELFIRGHRSLYCIAGQ